MEKMTLEQIQQASLNILLEVDAICAEQNLTYYLAYGTLIGAVRHHGFIPWDDDLDIMMPRRDMEKLFAYLESSGNDHLKVCSRATVENYPYGIPRIADMRYRYVSSAKDLKDFDIGAFIDVYPLEPFGDDEQTAERILKKIMRKHRLFGWYLNPNSGSLGKRVVKRIVRGCLVLTKGKHYEKTVDKEIQSIVTRYADPNDRLTGIPTWSIAGQPHLLKKEWFASMVRLEFEGHPVCAPSGYDALLTYIYGDYMTPPPEDKRVQTHEYALYKR